MIKIQTGKIRERKNYFTESLTNPIREQTWDLQGPYT